MSNINRFLITPLILCTSIGLFISCKTNQVKSSSIFNDSSATYTINKVFTGNKYAVVCAHPLASLAGQQVMAKGGNAFDAAIAMQLALAVVYPAAGNIGGGGFMIAHLKTGENLALDFREKAGSKASRDMYLDATGNALTEKSQNGHLAAGIPGTIAGIIAMLPYAKLPLAILCQPAINYAKNGFAITDKEANNLNANKANFLKYNTHTPALIKNGLWAKGNLLVQTELAYTLTRIQKNGAAGFYQGETANYIVAEMQKGGGILTLNDLKNYKATWRKPLVFNYNNHQIISMPPPSSGGIILNQLLTFSKLMQLNKYNYQSQQAVNIMVEAERLAYADRADFMGDPDFVKVPVKTLTSDGYLQKRLNNFTLGQAGKSSQTKAGNITQSEETTHLNVIDSEGNAVSLTTTLNGNYGSKTVVAGAGFLLNNEMDDFSIKPGTPNMYGAIGGEANSIAPGKTMLSSMTPTIVLQNNALKYIVGTPGGTTIPTSVYQTIVNLIDFNLSPEDAVWLPKFHHQWLPDEVFVEQGFNIRTIEALKNMGYKITNRSAIGRTELIVIDANKKIKAVADTRGDDDARGK